MGVLKRLKKAPSGVGETIDEVRANGFIGGLANSAKRFSKRNADEFKTLGEDVGARR